MFSIVVGSRHPSAETINAHLADGGVVQVSTHLKSWLYTAKHAGWFSNRNNHLFVRHGRGVVSVEYASVRLGREA